MSLFKQIKIILWAFLGVRSNKGREEDSEVIKNPLVFIFIGLILFFIFVLLLIIGVHIIV